MEFIWQYKDIANTIVLGSSRAYDAINPLLITPPFYAINLAVHGNTIGGDYKILTNYILPHIKEAKVIITSIDIDRWNMVHASFFESDYKSYPGYIYDQNHNYWKGGYPDGLAEATYDSPGETGQSDVNRPTRGFAAQKNHGWGEPSIGQDSTWINKFSNEFEKNFNVLVEMIELCLQKNIILIGVITPQNPRYKETGAFGNGGLLRSQAPELIKQITDLNSLYPNFILMDENKMGNHDYTDDMAFDSSHLSRKGAEQLTSRLDSLIQTCFVFLSYLIQSPS